MRLKNYLLSIHIIYNIMSISDIHALSKAYYELDELNRIMTEFKNDANKARQVYVDSKPQQKPKMKGCSFFANPLVKANIFNALISGPYYKMKQEIKDKEEDILALKRKAFENIDWHELYPSDQDKSYDDWISQAQHDYRISQIQH